MRTLLLLRIFNKFISLANLRPLCSLISYFKISEQCFEEIDRLSGVLVINFISIINFRSTKHPLLVSFFCPVTFIVLIAFRFPVLTIPDYLIFLNDSLVMRLYFFVRSRGCMHGASLK